MSVDEPLFVFCAVCRRHVKRGPDSTLAVTLRRHKAHVHGLGMAQNDGQGMANNGLGMAQEWRGNGAGMAGS